MDIGQRIRYFRRQYDMDQRDLGRAMNVSNRTISSWETGRTEPRIEMIDKMCQIFHCRRSDFLSDMDLDYIVKDEHENEYLIECYRRATPEDRRLIDSILYKYSDVYNQLVKQMAETAPKIEEAEKWKRPGSTPWYFDEHGLPTNKPKED